MDIITVILTISSICSAILGITAFVAVIFKKPKLWLKKWITSIVKQELAVEVKELTNELEKIKDTLNNLIDHEKTKLGHSIMTIYDRSIARGYITIADKKDLIELHAAYKSAYGNHHVDEYFEIMMDMDVR